MDRNGHALTFHYGPAAGDFAGVTFQWPLLASVTNDDGTALLTIARVADGSGAVAAVSDCYGRSVLYHVSQYANFSGAASAPDRYAYGYQGGGRTYLHTISVPNPSGTATLSTATIDYASDLTVADIQDGNGYKTSFASAVVTGSTGGGSGDPGSSAAPGGTLTTSAAPSGAATDYTRVTYAGAGQSYSYVSGYDMNMSGALQTDGAGRVTMSKTFDATSPDPYRPTSQTDGNGKTTQMTWDQYGNMTSETPPSSAQRTPAATVNTYSYSNFPLGELTQTQVGTKSITKPRPGTSGTGATVSCSFQYDGYGDITQMTTPGNNAASSITTAFNYGSAPAIGQPLTVTDALAHATSFTYDAQGNKTSQTDAGYVAASGATVQNTTVYGDVSGHNGYNLANQPLLTLFPATGQTGGGRAGTAMSYLYPGGPLLAVRSYDESGSLAREVDTSCGPEGEAVAASVVHKDP